MNLESQKPEVIFFDAVGTLLHLPRGVAAHYCEVARRHGFEPEERRLGKAFGAAFRQMPPPATTRAARADDDRGWWQALVEEVLRECGAPPKFDREAYFRELYEEFTKPGVWAWYPEVPEVLAALREKFRLGIISNFDGRLRRILRGLGADGWFEVMAISSEVGADKPDPWIYERAVAMASVFAAAALHVGDDPECDWDAASAAGLQVFRLDRPKNDLRDLLTELAKTESGAVK